MTVFFSSAHFPYAAPAPYYRQQTDPAYRGAFRYQAPLAEPANPEDVAQVRGLYDGALAAADDGVARILAGLSRLGLPNRRWWWSRGPWREPVRRPGRGMGHGDHLEAIPRCTCHF